MTDKRKISDTLDIEYVYRLLFCLVLTLVTVATVYFQQHPRPPFAFPLPADVCMVDDAPVILSQNTGYPYTQTYVRTDGATVRQEYGYSALTGTVSLWAAELWFGNDCDDAKRGQG